MKVKIIKANLSESSITVRVNNERLVKLILSLQPKDKPIILDYFEEQMFALSDSHKDNLKELLSGMLEIVDSNLTKDKGTKDG